MNELIAAAKSGHGKGNSYSRLKRQWTDSIALLAKRLPRYKRVSLSFMWIERDRRRDPDNIAAGGRKLILDGLVVAGMLPGDGWAHVAGWTDSFVLGTEAGVDVTIEDYAA